MAMASQWRKYQHGGVAYNALINQQNQWHNGRRHQRNNGGKRRQLASTKRHGKSVAKINCWRNNGKAASKKEKSMAARRVWRHQYRKSAHINGIVESSGIKSIIILRKRREALAKKKRHRSWLQRKYFIEIFPLETGGVKIIEKWLA